MRRQAARDLADPVQVELRAEHGDQPFAERAPAAGAIDVALDGPTLVAVAGLADLDRSTDSVRHDASVARAAPRLPADDRAGRVLHAVAAIRRGRDGPRLALGDPGHVGALQPQFHPPAHGREV